MRAWKAGDPSSAIIVPYHYAMLPATAESSKQTHSKVWIPETLEEAIFERGFQM